MKPGASFLTLRHAQAPAQVDNFEYNSTSQLHNGIPTHQAKTRFAMEKAGGSMFRVLDPHVQGGFSLVTENYEVVIQK
jgi:hypothetical protein